MSRISDKVQQELLSWQGVTMHDHRFGGVEFRINGIEDVRGAIELFRMQYGRMTSYYYGNRKKNEEPCKSRIIG
jgi:hypothetical protein